MKLSKAVLVSVAGLMLASVASAHQMGNGPAFSFYKHQNSQVGNNDRGFKDTKFYFQGPKHQNSYSSMVNCEPTPEPGTWAMMIVGAGLVGFQLRRKQKDLGSLAV